MKNNTAKLQNLMVTENLVTPCLQIGKRLTSTLDLQEILTLILEKISQLAEADNWSLLLKDEPGEHLRFKVAVGIDMKQVENIRIPLGRGVAGRVAKSGKPLFVADAASDPRIYREIDNITGFVTRSLICIPLNIHGKTLGVIEIVNIDDIEAFRLTKLPALSILADYAAIAIENSQQLLKIRKLSITDEYTGLYNARYLHEILPGLLCEAEKTRQPLAIVFIDIDNFKTIVDRYGHLAGSLMLREIGTTIQTKLGDQDILIKYGGDEYILILPGKSKKEAICTCRDILNQIRRSTYLSEEKTPVKLTASFGISLYPEDAGTAKELLLKADGSMYKVKNSTKNGIGIC